MASACLRQLARTCAELDGLGVDATAVVVADDESLEVADDLGFATVERDNAPLGRKWNDGYQLACDPGLNPRPADFVIPFGSDDWIDARWVIAQLQAPGELRCSRLSAVVREDGRMLMRLNVRYEDRGGPAFGDGVRMIPRQLLQLVGYRPAEEDRARAIDTSVWRRLCDALGRRVTVSFTEVHPFQIVDFKTSGAQLNEYRGLLGFRDGPEDLEPWETLSRFYPDEAVSEIRQVYEPLEVAA